MWSLALVVSVGLMGVAALPSPPSGPLNADLEHREIGPVVDATPSPRPTLSPSCNNQHLMCIPEMELVYNATSKICECEWIPGLEPGGPVSSSKRETNPCADIVCTAEKQPKFNAVSGACQCEWIPGFEPGGIYNPGVKRSSPPTDLCVGIFCIAEQEPVLNKTTKNCECEWIPGFEPGGIYNPGVKRDELTAERCVDIVCIAEKHPVYNSAAGKCECEWIPGLEPTHTTTSTPPPFTRPPICAMMCARGETAAVDPGTGDCSCSHTANKRGFVTSTTSRIPTPVPPVDPSNPTTTAYCERHAVCISEKHGVWNAELGRCECEWIPGFGSGPITML